MKQLLQQKRRWPQAVRTLRTRISREAGNFWENVVETHAISIKRFAIPRCTTVQFSFIDPIFLWVQRCVALHQAGIDLIWDPKILLDPITGEEMYGSGVEFGLLLRAAKASVPAGARVALISLSWDAGNTGFGSRSAKPICLQVMNCNSASPLCVALLGYVPHLNAPAAFKDEKILALARRHVIQAAIGHVLQAIEASSVYGFRAQIGNSDMWFMPRVGALPLDTPERADYFGMRSQRACGICRFRSGRSATRTATRHDPAEISALYAQCTQYHTYMLTVPHICSLSHIYAHCLKYMLTVQHICIHS